MAEQTFIHRSRIEAPVEEVFMWHMSPGALERLTPPWASVEVERRIGSIHDRGSVTLKVRIGPIDLRWVLRHQDFILNQQFRDVQAYGPFKSWEHTHLFTSDGPSSCVVEDSISYELPGGSIGDLLGSEFTKDKLERLFRYRHKILAQDLATRRKYEPPEPLSILITGSTGLVGSALIPFLRTQGHQVTRLVRSEPRPGEPAILWKPASGRLDGSNLEGFDVMIHLAGESIAGRWTEEKKERIRYSRANGTRLLSEALARLERPPKVLISASATGYYGNRGDDILLEDERPGSGFLANVCRQWEAATEPAAEQGIRVVNCRLGVVLSPKGGALSQMLPLFKMGMGGKLGSGDQYMSWIAMDDLLQAFAHAIARDELRGPVNVVSPNPVRNWEFTRILGHVLSRPTILPVPAAALHTFLGEEMTDEVLLASIRTMPDRLSGTGYTFFYPELGGALRHLLGR